MRHMWGKREFLTANDKDFSLALEMTVREGSQSPATPIVQENRFAKSA